jgi:hypothetical protein
MYLTLEIDVCVLLIGGLEPVNYPAQRLKF